MSYWFEKEKIKLPPDKDRRRKLSDDQKEHIRQLHRDGVPIRQINREHYPQVSRRLLQFIIFPDRNELNRQRNIKKTKELGNPLQRYGREYWTETMREHRQHKAKMLKHDTKASKT